MNATAKLQELGQSLWLDNITREMLDSGQLQRYIEEFSITGLTSNPSIGIERRVRAGLNPDVASVASVFMSRWDAAVLDQTPAHLRGRLALAIGAKAYQAYRQVIDSDRWQRLANAGARVQRLLWASTSTKDPNLPDTLYVEGLAAPNTINTITESTLLALDDHGHVGDTLSADRVDAEATLARFGSAGIDIDALAATLQSDGAEKFVKAWNDLLQRIEDQGVAVGS